MSDIAGRISHKCDYSSKAMVGSTNPELVGLANTLEGQLELVCLVALKNVIFRLQLLFIRLALHQGQEQSGDRVWKLAVE